MCEGKGYDEKSDIWALGCIVYEMACLQKTFEGSNLPGTIFLDKFLTFFWKKGTYRVFELGLYENKHLLGHQKCTFKS